ncbi:DNA polymerase zeta processivity subunit [Zostera marina]|uniref:DNA polymerase zeta processivity subunit n=1 Tax=Zostera marina TaxID=29655 RepID=A0A0K9P611_ZOSMR|nr:DNA polymerase zeta processivity subunit [Zostera marina]
MNHKNQTPQGETAQIMADFLEVAITTILFLKGVYPRGAFERRRYMNIVVQKARHPQLADYIHSVITALQPFLQKGSIERVLVIFYNKDQVPVEKFVFKLSINQLYKSKVEQKELEFALRAFLIKLTVSESITIPLPTGCWWEITGYFRALPEVGSSKWEPSVWIPTDTKQWQSAPEITPIKSLCSDPLNLQLYLEHPCHSEAELKDSAA